MIRGWDIKEQEMKWKDSNRGQEIKKKKGRFRVRKETNSRGVLVNVTINCCLEEAAVRNQEEQTDRRGRTKKNLFFASCFSSRSVHVCSACDDGGPFSLIMSVTFTGFQSAWLPVLWVRIEWRFVIRKKRTWAGQQQLLYSFWYISLWPLSLWGHPGYCMYIFDSADLVTFSEVKLDEWFVAIVVIIYVRVLYRCLQTFRHNCMSILHHQGAYWTSSSTYYIYIYHLYV